MRSYIAIRPVTSVESRFWTKVDKLGPKHPVLGTRCWVWTGTTDKEGYGQIGHKRPDGKWTMLKAHRVSYRMKHRLLPKWLGILHKCDNPPCVRPSHLFSGTDKDNMRDAWSKGRRSQTGSKNARARLSEKAVAEIRKARALGAKAFDLALKYGVPRGTIYSAWSGRHTWKSVTP